MAKGSKRWQLDKKDLTNILKVLGYSVGSALCAALIAVLAQADIPEAWLFIVPLVNTLLVTAKKWFESNS